MGSEERKIESSQTERSNDLVQEGAVDVLLHAASAQREGQLLNALVRQHGMVKQAGGKMVHVADRKYGERSVVSGS